MRKRSPLAGAWRLIAVCVLMIGVLSTIPASLASAAAQAVSVLTVTAVDELGTPLAGAEFGVFTVVDDPTTEGGLIAGDEIIAGPLPTDETGTVIFAGLPDNTFVAVLQTYVPDGYLPETFPERIVTTNPEQPLALTYVNALEPVVPGAVDVVVADGETGEPLGDASVQVMTINEDGSAGDIVDAAITGAEGYVTFSLEPGDYYVSVAANPGGYTNPIGLQVVSVEPTDQGVADYDLVTFPLVEIQPDPTEAPADPTATTPVDPTATTAPTETPEPPPAPATVIVETIVCTTEDGGQVGSVDYRLGTSIQLSGTALPSECRAATQDEFSFVLVDPADRNNSFDDVQIASKLTDPAGLVTFEVPLTEQSRTVYLYEVGNPTPFSDAFDVVSGESYSVLAMHFVASPVGDIVVRTADSVSGSLLIGECYALAAAGAETAPIAELCDADDGTEDGLITFTEVPNGTYSVTPTQTAPNYVPASSTQIVVNSGSVDVTFSATPYGSLSILAYACVVPADDMESAEVAFAVSVGQPTSDGTELGLSAELAANVEGCTPTDAELEIVPPGENTEPFFVSVTADGLSAPVALRPTGDGAAYIIRDPGTGSAVEVAIQAAVRTTVTVALPVVETDDADVEAAGIGGESVGIVPQQTADGTAIHTTTTALPGSITSNIAPNMTEADRAELRNVTTLPRTGAGVPGLEAGGGERWPIVSILLMLTVAMAVQSVAPFLQPRRQ